MLILVEVCRFILPFHCSISLLMSSLTFIEISTGKARSGMIRKRQRRHAGKFYSIHVYALFLTNEQLNITFI